MSRGQERKPKRKRGGGIFSVLIILQTFVSQKVLVESQTEEQRGSGMWLRTVQCAERKKLQADQ